MKNVKYLNFDRKQIIIFILSIVFISIIYFSFSLNAIITDSDSGFEYTNAQNIALYGKIERGPVIQQFLYAFILGIAGFNYKIILIFQTILTLLIIIVTFQFVRKKVSANSAFLVPFLFLYFPVFYFGNYTLKQYPLFLFLLFLSLYYFDKYLTDKKNKTLFLSALFLGTGIMTHLLVLPFIGFAGLYYFLAKIFKKKKLIFKDVLKFYFILFLIISPFVVWEIINSTSLQAILTYPSAWVIMKYGRIINKQFWGYPYPFTIDYFHEFFELLKNWVFILPLLPFLILGLIKNKDKTFIIIWFLMLFAPYLVGRGVIRWVYTYPFIPLVVILSVIGLNELLKLRMNKRVRALIICTIIILSGISYSLASVAFSQRIKYLSPAAEDASNFNKFIPENSNILFRSRSLSNYFQYKNILMIGKDLSEKDAITYLNWTSDEKVAEVFKKYDISYVILYKNIRFEKDYHIWFKLVTGHEPRHYYMIEKSLFFKKLKEGRQFILYEFLKNH